METEPFRLAVLNQFLNDDKPNASKNKQAGDHQINQRVFHIVDEAAKWGAKPK